MIQEAIDQIPLEHRFRALHVLFAILAVGFVALAAWLGTSHVIVQTRTVHDKPSYGKLVQTVSGTQIGLQGGVCDVYQSSSKLILVCHQ